MVSNLILPQISLGSQRTIARVVVCDMEVPASQTSSHFPLEPISADILAENEAKRRAGAKALGLLNTGCTDLDGYVLFGGLERGCVVGMSAEDEAMGLLVSHHLFPRLSDCSHKI